MRELLGGQNREEEEAASMKGGKSVDGGMRGVGDQLVCSGCPLQLTSEHKQNA